MNQMNLELLYGVYELQKIENFVNGEKTSLTATSGMFTFTRDHRVSVVSGSNEWVMAYVGSFEVKNTHLLMKAEACVKRELEGTILTREIIKLDGEWLVLKSANQEGGYTELSWKKKISL